MLCDQSHYHHHHHHHHHHHFHPPPPPPPLLLLLLPLTPGVSHQVLHERRVDALELELAEFGAHTLTAVRDTANGTLLHADLETLVR
jgi:hypothetical protein